MSNRKNVGVFIALITGLSLTTPVSAYYPYDRGHYHPHYNNYAYRDYGPSHGHPVLLGAGIGAAAGALVGLLAAHHGHGYNY